MVGARGRVRRLVLVATGAVALAACGLRAPHSEVVAQYQQAVGATSSVPGQADGAAPGADGADGTAPAGAASQAPSTDAPGTPATQAAGDTGPAAVTATGGTAPSGVPTAQATASGRPGGGGGRQTASTAKATATVSSPAAGSDHSPIVIGADGTLSGISAVGATGKSALLAWEKWVNGMGGLSGHPVTIDFEDNTGDANKEVADVQDLVENKHVTVLIPNAATDETGWQSFVESKGVPVVGGYQTTEIPWSSTDFFPEDTDQHAEFRGFVGVAAQIAHSKVADVLYCVEGAVCKTIADTAAAYAPKVGITVKRESGISVATPDFTTQCLQAQADGADLLVVLADAATLQRVASSCSSQGYRPTYVGQGGASLQTNPALQGMLTVGLTFDWNGTATPAQQNFQQVMKAAGVVPDDVAADMWASAEELRLAVSKISGPVTGASIAAALQTFSGETLGGLVPSPGMTFHKGQHADINNCFVPMEIRNNLWGAAGAAVCSPP